jgi:cytochrome P450
MAYLAGSLFGAGADTTAVAIMVLVMAAACYPKAQEKVQEELDTVVGRDRGVSNVGVYLSEHNTILNLVVTAPTFDDYNSLPQIEAFMLECLRWRPVTTLGFAHRALTDIVYVRFHCILA